MAISKIFIRYSIYALVIILLTVFLTAIFVYLSPTYVRRTNQPIVLQSAEVREYQGKNLSSINDFIDNSIKGPQYIDVNNYKLKIGGKVAVAGEYTYDDIINNFTTYKKVVILNCVEGWSVDILWEGFLVRDLLAQVKPQPAANTVILRAADGYSTSFPLSYFYDNDIIIAYKMNGVTLPPERGLSLPAGGGKQVGV